MIIFVHSRKDTFKTGEAIKEYFYSKNLLPKLLREDSDSKRILAEIAGRPEAVQSAQLRALLPFGIGIHHAGLERADRALA
jgi:pre-mRNA-splicing helicase BRR2